MKKILALVLTTIMSFNVSAEEETKDPAIEAATRYFEAMMTGDLDTADNLVAVPAMIASKIAVLRTKEEVKANHRRMFKQAGKREVPESIVTRPTEYPKLDNHTFKDEYVAVKIEFLEDKYNGHNLYVYLKENDGVYKVISILQ